MHNNPKLGLVLCLLQILAVVNAAGEKSAITLENNGEYKIENVADKGVLALNSSSPKSVAVILDKWTGAPDQRWKDKETVCQRNATNHVVCKPSSHDADKDILDADSSTAKVFAVNSECDTKYWMLHDMGDGITQIQNYQLGSCIGSTGLQKLVTLVKCDNSTKTQWVFTKLNSTTTTNETSTKTH